MCARSRPTLCENSAVGCHFLLQGILLTQGLNPQLLCLLHGPADSLPVATPRKPHVIKKLQQRASSLNIQRIFVIKKKNRYPKWRNLALFYVWEGTRVWAHWNHPFHMHLSCVASILCFFTSWAPLGLILRSGCNLIAVRFQVFSPFWVPWRAGIADECDILVYWYGRRYSMCIIFWECTPQNSRRVKISPPQKKNFSNCKSY